LYPSGSSPNDAHLAESYWSQGVTISSDSILYPVCHWLGRSGNLANQFSSRPPAHILDLLGGKQAKDPLTRITGSMHS